MELIQILQLIKFKFIIVSHDSVIKQKTMLRAIAQ